MLGVFGIKIIEVNLAYIGSNSKVWKENIMAIGVTIGLIFFISVIIVAILNILKTKKFRRLRKESYTNAIKTWMNITRLHLERDNIEEANQAFNVVKRLQLIEKITRRV